MAGESTPQLRHATRVRVAEDIVGRIAHHAPDRSHPSSSRERARIGFTRAEVVVRSRPEQVGFDIALGFTRQRCHARAASLPGGQVSLGDQLLVRTHDRRAGDIQVIRQCPTRRQRRVGTQTSGADRRTQGDFQFGTSRDAARHVVPESQQEIGHDLTLREPTKVVCQYRSLLVLFGGPLDRTVDTMTLQRWVRIALGYHIVVGTQIGLWALFAPRSFYDGFPGLGRSWVAVDGPFNEHLIRDVGALNLALVVLYDAAWMGLGHQLVRASGAASLVWGVPHALSHLFNTDGLGGIDVAMSLSGLVVHVIVGAGLVWAGGRLERVENSSPLDRSEVVTS